MGGAALPPHLLAGSDLRRRGALSLSDFLHFDLLLARDRPEVELLFRLACNSAGLAAITRDQYLAARAYATREQLGAPPAPATTAERRAVARLFGRDGRRTVARDEFAKFVYSRACPPALHGFVAQLRAEQETFLAAVQDRLAVDLNRRRTGLQAHAPGSGFFDHAKNFLLTGGALCVITTAMAPLERLKLVMQVQSPGTHFLSMGKGLSTLVRQDGLRSLWRGNALNLLRVLPLLGFQLAAYQYLKRTDAGQGLAVGFWTEDTVAYFERGDLSLEGRHLAAGVAAGLAAGLAVHPLDVVRANLTAARGPSAPGALDVVRRLARQDGGVPRALARGLAPGLAWSAAALGLGLPAVAALKPLVAELRPGHPLSAGAGASVEDLLLRDHAARVAAGAAAGLVALVVAHPFDVVRRRMQVLRAMSNSERKQQNALDNQAQEYGDATFRAMEVLLKLLAAHVDPPEKVDNLLKRVEQCEKFLKHDFSDHLSPTSRIANHCMQHALGSDIRAEDQAQDPRPKARGYASACQHEHHKMCLECEEPRLLLAEIDTLITTAGLSDKERTLMRAECSHLGNKMEYYLAHLIRSKAEDGQRAKVIAEMNPGDCCVVGDFKMKFRPNPHAEAHSEFFAKTGWPWHGLMLMWMDNERQISYNYVNHISMDQTEDHQFVLCAIVEAFKEVIIGKTDPPVRRVVGFFDNAGCYKGQDMCYGWSKITEFLKHLYRDRPEVIIPLFTEIFIAESGRGKTELDGHFGRCASLLRLLINMGPEFDCVDAYSLVKALDNLHLPGVINAVLQIDRSKHFTLKASTFEDIGCMAHRWVDYDVDGKAVALVMERTSNLPGSMPISYAMAYLDGRVGGRVAEQGFGGSVGVLDEVPAARRAVMSAPKVKSEGEVQVGKHRENKVKGFKRSQGYVKAAGVREKRARVVVSRRALDATGGTRMVRCPDPKCSRVYTSQVYVVRHVQMGRHNYTSENLARNSTGASKGQGLQTRLVRLLDEVCDPIPTERLEQGRTEAPRPAITRRLHYRVKMEADESYEFTLVCSAPGYALRSGSGKFQHHKIWSKRHIDLFVDAFSSQKVRRGAGVMEKKMKKKWSCYELCTMFMNYGTPKGKQLFPNVALMVQSCENRHEPFHPTLIPNRYESKRALQKLYTASKKNSLDETVQKLLKAAEKKQQEDEEAEQDEDESSAASESESDESEDDEQSSSSDEDEDVDDEDDSG